MISLIPHPPEFVPDGRLTIKCMNSLDFNSTRFLWPEEVKIFKYIMHLNQDVLDFKETDRGTLKESYLLLYIIPTIPHVPWKWGRKSLIFYVSRLMQEFTNQAS